MATTNQLSRAYAEIWKTEKQDDGSLMVWGKATGPDLDSDKQICDPEWLKTAMPDWFKFGNVREQHSQIAAGVGHTLEQDGNSWNVGVHVVDPGSVKKIEAKVLKGFSVGISAPKIVKDMAAPGGRIVGGEIVEVSLVDRPANPTCVLTLAKSVAGVLTKDETMSTDGTGADPAEDPAEGDEVDLIAVARDALNQWLAQEAEEVVDGTGGRLVVQLICNVLSDLDWAVEADTYDDAQAALEAVKTVLTTPTSEADVLTLSTLATLTKAASDDDKDTLAEIRKSIGAVSEADVSTRIAEAVTKAVKPLEEIIDDLKAEQAKVNETVMNSGPVRVRAQADATKASATDAALREAAHWGQQAEIVTDPILRSGYLAKAAAARATIEKE